jgi:oligo-alginate lyase
MNKLPSPERIQKIIPTYPWAIQLVDAMRATVNHTKATFTDDVNHISGWGHNYFCDSCGGRLAFNMDTPTTHLCTACGKVNTGTDFDEAWVYLYRNQLSSTLVEAACLFYLDKQPDDATFVKHTIQWYADRYNQFPVHGRWAGTGKIMGQSLCEAVFGLRLLKALSFIQPQCNSAWMEEIFQLLFQPMTEHILNQDDTTPNITLWLKSFIAAVGIVFDAPHFVEIAHEGETGLFNRLQSGTSEDYIWYEGSLHYHFYALEGITEYLNLCYLYNKPDSALSKWLQSMYLTPIKLSYSDLRLPNPNDGWYQIGLYTYANQYELMKRIAPHAWFDTILQAIYTQHRDNQTVNLVGSMRRMGVYSLESLINLPLQYEPENIPIQSCVLEASNMAVLRNSSMEVFHKFGFNTESHAHRDQMTIEIPPFSYDLSNPGYGNPYHHSWYRNQISHNTVIVDEQNQICFPTGSILDYCPNPPEILTEARDMIPGVTMRRHLKLSGSVLFDTFMVEADTTHQFDYVFHSQGIPYGDELWSDVIWEPRSEWGYHLIQHVKCHHHGNMGLTWKKDGLQLTLQVQEPVDRCFTFSGMDNPSTETRRGILLRINGKQAVFAVRFELSSS